MINERYVLDEHPTGQGAMGDVWFGRDNQLDRPIVVKFLADVDGVSYRDLTSRFRREARITARLEHPGVPAVYDVDASHPRPYLVMQRIDGRTIADMLHEHAPFSVSWSCSIAAQVCAVLAAAHRASLIHRDLKPANLMLCSDGTIKVLDFGLAVALELADFSRITLSGQVLGTPAYMSPEQILGGAVGPRTDLYALGCVLFELLTGRRVFSGTSSYSMQHHHVHTDPPDLREYCPEAPDELAVLLRQLLAKSAQERPHDADETFERLQPFVGSPSGNDALSFSVAPDPVRMYASAVARTYATAPKSTGPTASTNLFDSVDDPPRTSGIASSVGVVPEPQTAFDREDIALAREEADELVHQTRYSEAIEVLESAISRGVAAYGTRDSDVLALRLEHVNAVYAGGDPSLAAELYADLATDYAARKGTNAFVALQCREREARCRIQLGDGARALELLRTLAEQLTSADQHNSRAFELRRQIGKLEVGQGQLTAAQRTLESLRQDAAEALGELHPITVDAHHMLEALSTAERSR